MAEYRNQRASVGFPMQRLAFLQTLAMAPLLRAADPARNAVIVYADDVG